MISDRIIPVAHPDLSGNEETYLSKCISTSWISSKGEFIHRFEKEFARFCGTKYAISTSNGTAALHLAILSLGIKEGDEVILPDLTFVSCANAVRFSGATPVFTEVNKGSWTIDSDDLAKRISARTKAIIVVHLYGQPADLESIYTIVNKAPRTIYVIEDCAEAHGAQIKIGNNWKRVGSIGDVGCFSFYGNKIITTGEGGMVVTNDKKRYEMIKILRNHGEDPKKKYYYKVIGYNYRMTNMQAAIGCAQLERVDQFISKKRKIAKSYDSLLKNIPGISIPKIFLWSKSVYWMYSILVDNPYPLVRDDLVKFLRDRGVETRPFFYPLHLLPFYESQNTLPNSEYLSKHGLNLPSGLTLSNQDIKKVTNLIRSQIQ